MLARTFTATMKGLEALKIEVEVDGTRGIPSLVFIGLPSKATEEARERITSALHNCGIRWRSQRTIVNLAPADVPKSGSSFDLAIAVGMLEMAEEIPRLSGETMFFGELALDGQVKKIRGALPLVLAARELGFQRVIIPAANCDEVSIVTGIEISLISHLQEYLEFAKFHKPLTRLQPKRFVPLVAGSEESTALDNILGQEQAKRALVIAAAGGHNVLLNGPPGVGKTLLAKALTTLLPPLSEAEAIEVTRIYSICGLTGEGETKGLIRRRPFRMPHHTISQAGLIGGGSTLKPGEITLAHRGILFLDEFPEFQRSSLEALRQPLEEKSISLSRASGTVSFPTNFTLIAAMNPCPCGYRFSTQKACNCLPNILALYERKLSGPLLDRFDLQVNLGEVEVEKLTRDNSQPNTGKEKIGTKITTARQVQRERYHSLGFLTTSELSSAELQKYCPLSPSAQKLLKAATLRLQLSARAYFKTIKVSQTIADLETSPVITEKHVAEALQYRLPVKMN